MLIFTAAPAAFSPGGATVTWVEARPLAAARRVDVACARSGAMAAANAAATMRAVRGMSERGRGGVESRRARWKSRQVHARTAIPLPPHHDLARDPLASTAAS